MSRCPPAALSGRDAGRRRFGLDGSAGLVVDASGAAVLAGDNSYSGGTVVTKGTLLVTNSGTLPPDGSLTVGAGSCLVFDPGANLAAIAGSRSIGAENLSPAPAFARSGNGRRRPCPERCCTTSSVLIAAASIPEVSQVAAVVGSAADSRRAQIQLLWLVHPRSARSHRSAEPGRDRANRLQVRDSVASVRHLALQSERRRRILGLRSTPCQTAAQQAVRFPVSPRRIRTLQP